MTLNLHPADGVGAHEDAYRAVCASVGKPADGTVVPFNVTDKQYMHAYFKHLHHPLEKQGAANAPVLLLNACIIVLLLLCQWRVPQALHSGGLTGNRAIAVLCLAWTRCFG